MEPEEDLDPDGELNRTLGEFGFPPVSPGGWDNPDEEDWGEL